MMIKKLLVLCVAMATFTVTQATERFVKFTPVEGALPLSNASISYSADEYEGVKIAINNLKRMISIYLYIDHRSIFSQERATF